MEAVAMSCDDLEGDDSEDDGDDDDGWHLC